VIRIEVADPADADHILTGLYILAGVVPAPRVAPDGALPLANEIARQLAVIDGREVDRDDA
jgi:hypothetical protein